MNPALQPRRENPLMLHHDSLYPSTPDGAAHSFSFHVPRICGDRASSTFPLPCHWDSSLCVPGTPIRWAADPRSLIPETNT